MTSCRLLVHTSGSSPRLRGTADQTIRGRRCSRFIPAPAGNRRHRGSRGARRSVHPRACGEQPSGCPAGSYSHGSSPRLRGTVVGFGDLHAQPRFIPAPAGNRRSAGRRALFRTVHPRACGEQGMPASAVDLKDGSSPRLRGTGPCGRRISFSSRFIPAPAGNRVPPALAGRESPVHPRACGEQPSV